MAKKENIRAGVEYCVACLADDKIFCPRDPDAQCLICGMKLCGAHIGSHLKDYHYVSLTLDHCREKDDD